jgi:hypothetical protein
VPKSEIWKARALVARFRVSNVSKRVGKDKASCFHQRQASRQLQEFAQQARRKRRNSVVDLASRRV